MRIVSLVVAVLAAQCAAMPLSGENGVLLQENGGLLPKTDDVATVEAEVDQAIRHDVNMDNMAKLGEAPKLDKDASSWEKKAMSQINAMSASEIAKSQSAAPDKLSAKFAADVKHAAKVMHAPGAKKTKKTMIGEEVHQALSNPKDAKKLKKVAEQAELDFNSAPVAFLQEQREPDDIGEDEIEDDHLHLLSGSAADVMKSINEQIGNMVNTKLGAMPADTSGAVNLDKFEKDRQGAAEFLSTKPVDKYLAKKNAKKKIEAELKAAQQDLGESQAKDKDADKRLAKKKVEAELKAAMKDVGESQAQNADEDKKEEKDK